MYCYRLGVGTVESRIYENELVPAGGARELNRVK